MEKYIDLHMHSTQSDGDYSPEELIEMAINECIRVLAITDHNILLPNYDELCKKYEEKIELVNGSEISASHVFTTGRQSEIHIVGLFIRGEDIKEFLQGNRSDGKQRAIAILERLKKECGIDLGNVEQLCERFKNGLFSRTNIAKLLMEYGAVKSEKEAFDVFIGDYGEKRAYVPNVFEYASISEVVTAIRNAGGIAVLAHPLSYGLSELEMKELLQSFTNAKGQGMEVYYGAYNDADRKKLKTLAIQHNLTPSCGSDFHRFDNARLNHRFPYDIYEGLQKRRA